MIRLWDLANGRELRRLAGHSGTARWVYPAPDGRALFSIGEDSTARLWDLGPAPARRR